MIARSSSTDSGKNSDANVSVARCSASHAPAPQAPGASSIRRRDARRSAHRRRTIRKSHRPASCTGPDEGRKTKPAPIHQDRETFNDRGSTPESRSQGSSNLPIGKGSAGGCQSRLPWPAKNAIAGQKINFMQENGRNPRFSPKSRGRLPIVSPAHTKREKHRDRHRGPMTAGSCPWATPPKIRPTGR